MKTKMLIAFFLLGTITLTSVAQTNSIDYFGQTPPGDSAVVFAPGIISLPNRQEHKITFSPNGNECYFVTSKGMYYTKYINNTWTEPVIAPFTANLKAGRPLFSADGKRLYFTCWNADYTNSDIWFIERTKVGWGNPQLLPSPINSPSRDESYTESEDGVGYINSNRSGNLDLWRIQLLADQSLQAENLGPTVNSSKSDFAPCVARDGSYLIFASGRTGGYTDQYLYICFNKGNNEWTKPISMNSSGAKINYTGFWQKDPSLSPDGKYLFFCHHTSSESRDIVDIYWVSTHVTVGLKKIAFASQNE